MQALVPPFSSRLILGTPLARHLAPVVDLLGRGQVRIAIAERLPLSELPRAHASSCTGRLTGKLVIIP